MPRVGYHQIADDLRRQIGDGTYPPGATLPAEVDLAQQYGVARETVRKALGLLKAEGLIATHARRRDGTYVPPRPVQLAVHRYVANLGPGGPVNDLGPWETACRDQGLTGRTEMLGVTHEPATAQLATELGVPAGTELVRRARRMWADDRPIQLQDAWMPAALVRGTPLADAAKISVGVYPAMRAAGLVLDHAVEAVAGRFATPVERDALSLADPAMVLEYWRNTRDPADRPIEALRVVSDARFTRLVYRFPLG